MLSIVALSLTGVMVGFNLLAAAAGGGGGGTDFVTPLLQGGPFALMVLLIITDRVTTPGERDRLRLENQALREEIKELNANVRLEVVPPLVQINALMKEVIEELSRNRPYPPETEKYRRY